MKAVIAFVLLVAVASALPMGELLHRARGSLAHAMVRPHHHSSSSSSSSSSGGSSSSSSEASGASGFAGGDDDPDMKCMLGGFRMDGVDLLAEIVTEDTHERGYLEFLPCNAEGRVVLHNGAAVPLVFGAKVLSVTPEEGGAPSSGSSSSWSGSSGSDSSSSSWSSDSDTSSSSWSSDSDSDSSSSSWNGSGSESSSDEEGRHRHHRHHKHHKGHGDDEAAPQDVNVVMEGEICASTGKPRVATVKIVQGNVWFTRMATARVSDCTASLTVVVPRAGGFCLLRPVLGVVLILVAISFVCCFALIFTCCSVCAVGGMKRRCCRRRAAAAAAASASASAAPAVPVIVAGSSIEMMQMAAAPRVPAEIEAVQHPYAPVPYVIYPGQVYAPPAQPAPKQ